MAPNTGATRGRRAGSRLQQACRALFVYTALLAPAAVGAQGVEDIACLRGAHEIRRVQIEGARDPDDVEVSLALATQSSSWFRRFVRLPIGAKHCVDSTELVRDRLRVHALHVQHGLFSAKTTISVLPVGAQWADIVFRIVEGPQTKLDSVHVAGLDSVPAIRDLASHLFGKLRGDDYNEPRILGAVDSVQLMLREGGRVRAIAPRLRLIRDTVRLRAWVEAIYAPGVPITVGAIDVKIRTHDGAGTPRVAEAAVRRRVSVEQGKPLRPSDILRSQRELFELDAYQLVRVDTSVMGTDSMRVTVNLTEAQTRSFRLGGGWGTLDCFRTQAKWIDRSPFGLAQRLEINARLSKIGHASPLAFAPNLCAPDVQNDAFSDELNYFLSATLNFTDLFGRKLSPALTFYSERRSEPSAYRRETPIGARLSFSAPLRPSITGSLSAQYEYGRTIADEAVSCLIFNACTVDEFARRQNNGSLGVIGLGATWDLTGGQVFQIAGLRARIESRTAFANLTGSADLFDRFLGEISYFRPITSSVTLAARIQIGGITKFVTTSGTSVPLQERFFAGGLSSVRGFAQNTLGDVVYLMNSATDTVARDPVAGTVTLVARPDTNSVKRTSPIGGEAMFVGNLELRLRDPRRLGPFQLAMFVDAGQVRRSADQVFQFSDLQYTPGIGARMETAFGLFRLDIGYNWYEARRGPAFLAIQPVVGSGLVPQGRLLCVSVGTLDQLKVATSEVIRPAGSICPATFAPAGGDSPFAKLVFHFGIGHAF